jgi:hypothetical protein
MDKDGQTPFIVGLQCKVRELMIILDNSDVNDSVDDDDGHNDDDE